MFSAGALMISDWSGPEEVDADKRWLKPLLGAIVYQAMHDGMLKVRIGVDPPSGEPFMKYFGTLDYDQDKQTWWDMVPLPAECYPAMVQVCLTLAELDQSLPIRGVIEARKGKKRLHLQVEVHEINSFEISWDPKYAIGRDQAAGNLPCEEENAADLKSDGANGEGADIRKHT